MHRFYQPDQSSKLEVTPPEGVSARWNESNFQLHVTVGEKGLFDLPIRVTGTGSSACTVLTVATASGSTGYTFRFRVPESTEKVSKVAVAGAFNGWSMDKNQLALGPDGTWTTNVLLRPGRHSYKFVVDGKWTLDPANLESEDNGLGEKNSVVVIPGEPPDAAPSIYLDRRDGNKVVVRAVKSRGSLARVSAVLESAAGAKPLAAVIHGDKIEVTLSEKLPHGCVRVIGANSENAPSNAVIAMTGATDIDIPWQDAVLYYALTDRFADGDKSNDKPVDNTNVASPANYHGGDLRGITRKIEDGYFEKLGVNTIWVAPLNRNPAKAYQESPEPHRWYTGYHGYWPVSSTELDPHIGTGKDLNALVEHAHPHGMKVIADLVLHHVHEEHPWWKEHRDWFGELELPDGRKNLRLWDEQQFTTWFEPYLPSFDFSKDAPVNALIENSIWWANTYKLDGFRLDAVKHILPSFWWKFRAALREKMRRSPGRRSTSLAKHSRTAPALCRSSAPTCWTASSIFRFTTRSRTRSRSIRRHENAGRCPGGVREDLRQGDIDVSAHRQPRQRTIHGLRGWRAARKERRKRRRGRLEKSADGRDPANYKKLELAQAFLMSIDGVPMIYYGDEIGMTGAGDPDNRRDMRFRDKVSGDERTVLTNFARLGGIRKSHPALRYGSRRTVLAENDRYAFVRAYFGDRVAVIFNRAAGAATFDLKVEPEMQDGDYIEALSGRKVTVKDGILHLDMPAQAAAFVTRAKSD